MKKHIAIHLLGGTATKAARAIGCDPSVVMRWPVDAHNNITSKRVMDAVIAALSRMRYLEAIGEGKAPDISSDELHDLMHVPEATTE